MGSGLGMGEVWVIGGGGGGGEGVGIRGIGGSSILVGCIDYGADNTTGSFSNTGNICGVTTSGEAYMNSESDSGACTNSDGDFGEVGMHLERADTYFEFLFTFVLSLYFLSCNISLNVVKNLESQIACQRKVL